MNDTDTKQQTKSKQRVRDHGEVFTAEREVKAMCDLVKDETERIDSRFLEPACGDGNFLAEILTRKLTVVRKKYGKSHLDYEKKPYLRRAASTAWTSSSTTCLPAASGCSESGIRNTPPCASATAMTRRARRSGLFSHAISSAATHSH